MRLHVLYRSEGGESAADRPPYHDERLNLIAFLRAAAAVPDVDVSFVNNGPVPAERLELMRSSDARVLQIQAPGSRASLRYALKYAMDSEWPDEDVLYVVEDDYLHVPEALERLDQAMRALPEVSYLLTYGSTATHPVGTAEHYAEIQPAGWRPGVPTVVGGQTWRPALAPTSTFAVRLGALRQDYRIFLQSHVPYRHHYLDLQAGLVWQGYEPYRWRDVAREAVGLAGGGLPARVRGIALAPVKAAFNLRAHRRPERRRLVYVAEPNLATHLETPFISPGRDWELTARQTQEWVEAGGLTDRGPDPAAAQGGSRPAASPDAART